MPVSGLDLTQPARAQSAEKLCLCWPSGTRVQQRNAACASPKARVRMPDASGVGRLVIVNGRARLRSATTATAATTAGQTGAHGTRTPAATRAKFEAYARSTPLCQARHAATSSVWRTSSLPSAAV